MRTLPAAALAAALLLPAAWPAPALAQAPRAGAGSSQAERNAVELRQGMTPEEVRKLLGKPNRTALKSAGSAAAEAPLGTLQWTYAWRPERILNVVFAARTPEQWYVNGWDWSTY